MRIYFAHRVTPGSNTETWHVPVLTCIKLPPSKLAFTQTIFVRLMQEYLSHIYEREGFGCSAAIFEKLYTRIILWHIWQTLKSCLYCQNHGCQCVCMCGCVCIGSVPTTHVLKHFILQGYSHDSSILTSSLYSFIIQTLPLPLSVSLSPAFSSSSSLQRFMWATYTTRAFNFTPG